VSILDIISACIATLCVSVTAFGCAIAFVIVGEKGYKIRDRLRSRRPSECEAPRSEVNFSQYMVHIPYKHQYEFVKLVTMGEIHAGGSFERAIKTDMAYRAALAAASVELSRELADLIDSM
jgi:hypothetical protein